MLKKELAKALGISPAMVTKLARRGMPVDDVDRAKKWRKRHLEPGRIKGSRYDPNTPRDARPDVTDMRKVTEVRADGKPRLDGDPTRAAVERNQLKALEAGPSTLTDVGDMASACLQALELGSEPLYRSGLRELRRIMRRLPLGLNPMLPACLWHALCAHTLDESQDRDWPISDEAVDALGFTRLCGGIEELACLIQEAAEDWEDFTDGTPMPTDDEIDALA